MSRFLSLLLICSPLFSYSADTYSLKFSKLRYMLGEVMAFSNPADPFGTGDEAILLRNGKEIFRVPIKATMVHSGLVGGVAGLYDAEYAIENISPEMTMRSLLTEYLGVTFGIGTTGAMDGAKLGYLAITLKGPIQFGGKKQWITLRLRDRNDKAAFILFYMNASYTTLDLVLDEKALNGSTLPLLDKPIGELKGPHADLNKSGDEQVKISLLCAKPKSASPDALTKSLIRLFIYSSNFEGKLSVRMNTHAVGVAGGYGSSAIYYDAKHSVKDGVLTFKGLKNFSLIQRVLQNRGSVISDIAIRNENGKTYADYTINSTPNGKPHKAEEKNVACEVEVENTNLSFSEYLSEYEKYLNDTKGPNRK